MTIDERIQEIFSQFGSDPSKCKSELLKVLEVTFSLGGELDPRDRTRAIGACNLLNSLAHTFENKRFVAAAEVLLQETYNNFALIQRIEKKAQIYKAGLSVFLADMYYRLGDKGAALRWLMYTHADDALVDFISGGGEQRLNNIYGMSLKAFSAFNQIAKENAQLIAKEGDDWSVPSAFPEDVVTRFVLKHPEHANFFAHPSSLNEFPLSQAYFSALLDKVKEVKEDKGKKKHSGTPLEDLASYLFLLIPGWVPSRNVSPKTEDFENDIVISNLNPAGNLTAELFGRHFLVECKNWSNSVGSNQIGYFLYRMRLTHCKFGVMFASGGIAGEKRKTKEFRYARNLISRAFHEDGSVCIVINQSELEELRSSQSSFWSMLLSKAREAQFGTSLYRG